MLPRKRHSANNKSLTNKNREININKTKTLIDTKIVCNYVPESVFVRRYSCSIADFLWVLFEIEVLGKARISTEKDSQGRREYASSKRVHKTYASKRPNCQCACKYRR